jgi:Transglutaminase-like superfamily
MGSKTSKFFGLPKLERRLLVQAILKLYWCRILLVFFSFKKLSEKFKEKPSDPGFDMGKAKQIRRAIIRANNLTFWRNQCLVSTFCARWMLNNEGIPSKAFLGVYKENNGSMKAHAWLKVENVEIVTNDDSFEKVHEF